MQVVRAAQTVVKREGLRLDSMRHVAQALPTDLPNHPRVRRITDQVSEFLREESQKLPDDQGYLGSSDIIESMFGKHKIFTGKSTHKGVGSNILLLPLLTVNWTGTLVRSALESTTCAEVTQWLKTTVRKPMPARTTPIRTRAQRRAHKKRHEPLSHSTVPV